VKRKSKLVFGSVGILLLLGVLGTTTMSATAEFVSPTAVDEGDYADARVNLEGVVTQMETDGRTVTFVVEDENASVPVVYEGTVPETLQNGRIVVAKGVLKDGRLEADKLSVRAHEGTERPEKSKE
jgi:cytochrome c-type biogenesis protein CcmE